MAISTARIEHLAWRAANKPPGSYRTGFIDLGALKGNRGSQNYAIPAGTDLRIFKSAVIWRRRFAVGLAVAPLQS